MNIAFFFIFRSEKITIDEKEFTITRQMFTFQTIEKTIEGNLLSLIDQILFDHLISSGRIHTISNRTNIWYRSDHVYYARA